MAIPLWLGFANKSILFSDHIEKSAEIKPKDL